MKRTTHQCFPPEPTTLKVDKYETLVPIICDICCAPTNTTIHVCRHKMTNGPRIIEGTNSRICGLATCISCQEKSSMEEDEFRDSCPFHCRHSKMDPNEHPLLERSEKNTVEMEVNINEDKDDNNSNSESRYSG